MSDDDPGSGPVDDGDRPYDDPLPDGRWAERLLASREPRAAYEGQTGHAFDRWQSDARDYLREVLGLDRIERAGLCDPDPRRLGAAEGEGYERQTWDLRVEPGLRVPFYLLLPDDADPPYPAVLTLHGHAEAGKDLPAGLVEGEAYEQGIEREERDLARQAVERGYAALAPDMRGFGGLAPPEDPRAGGTCRPLQLHSQLFGRTLVGDRVWDALRLAEFARDRPDLDADPLAVTGHSGGGAVALFAAALDERLAPVVVSSYFCAFADSILAVDHCTCNYVPGLLELGELWDVAGLLAPRPVRFIAGRDDEIFPLAGVRRAVENLRPMYEAAGAPDAVDLFVGEGGHHYFEDAAWSFFEARR